MSCLPKPVLRGHMKKKGFAILLQSIAFAGVNALLYNFLYRVPKWKAHEEFLRTYDAEAHSRDLVNWGYFQTVRPEDIKK